MDIKDLRVLHRDALLIATEHVRALTTHDLVRPTPCARWDLGALLAHMVGQHHGFAAAIARGWAPRKAYAPVPFTRDGWAASVDELAVAVACADDAAEIVEVELHPTKRLSLDTVVAAQLLDTVVHTWDVARTLHRTFRPGADIAAVVYGVASTIPDNTARTRPGAAFAPRLPADGDDDTWDQTLALLGRDRHWSFSPTAA